MPKGKVLTILQEKGGVGKSIATMNVAYYLSRTDKVLIIDLDGQAADITYYMLGNSVDNTSYNTLTIMDVFRGKKTLKEVILNVDKNIDIIPASVDVASLSTVNKVTVFRKMIKELSEIYDYIMIDVTPSPSQAHLLAMSAPNQNIIPIINADAASLKALLSLNLSIEDVRETSNPSVSYLGIIVNRYDSRTNISKEIVSQAERIAESLETSLFDTKIRQSVILSEQVMSHGSIFDYAPNSSAASDYEKIGAEIKQRLTERR